MIQIDIDPKEFPTSGEVSKLYQESFQRHGTDAIQKLRDKFSAVLKRGAIEDVGASGAASENVLWRFQAGDQPEFQVYEGSGTIANAKIRSGLKKKHKVSYGTLRTWAADKGIKLYYNEDEPRAILDKLTSKNGVQYERSRWFGRVGIKPASSLSPSQTAMKGLYALKTALFKHGTNRPTADWFPLRPMGSGKYNYPLAVFMAEKSSIKEVMTEFGAKVSDDYTGVFTKRS